MKQEIIKSTNGAVLHSPVPNSATHSLGTGGSQLDYYYRYYYVSSINQWSPTTYNEITWQPVADIFDHENLEGQPDGYTAELWTQGWDMVTQFMVPENLWQTARLTERVGAVQFSSKQ